MEASSTARPARRQIAAPLWLLAVAATAALSMVTIHLLSRWLLGDEGMQRPAEQSLRLLTWNIGKIYLPWDSRAADHDLAHVARVIKEVDPEVVALQEIRDPTQLGRLLSLLGPAWHGKVPEDLYDRRAALLTQLPVQFVDVPTTTGRVAQGGVITLPSHVPVTVVSLHLDAFDSRRRLRQGEEILTAARRFGHPDLVVMGDFNFDPADARRDDADLHLYNLLTKDLVDAGRDQGATTIISRRLDYVFFRSSQVLRHRHTVLLERRINIMDHDPVLVELALKR
ncbi:MAG: endonuclease/exonuclease/phosphatase family protein [Deltaproteobacteria bacterium]|nr:endonuclease/exonuclease/phosphatase family protein [Deltaproteobacteria bacterium]